MAGNSKLTGKVAIITGASSGIGMAIAELFAQEGARVVVSDIDTKGGNETVEAIKRFGGEAFFAKTDVTKHGDVEKMVEAAVQTYKGLDILVNNAGIMVHGTILEIKEEDWDRILAVNLKGVYLCSKLAVPRIIERGGGAIINLASTGGLVGFPAVAAYNASKGGVVSLTKNMAIDFAPYNIRVNCICPGLTMTLMARQIFIDMAEGDISKADKMAESGIVNYPLKRYGSPNDIARAALFLACEDSSFMTGASLVVDGGFTAR